MKPIPIIFTIVFILIMIAEFSVRVDALICYTDDSGFPTKAYILNKHTRFEEIQKENHYNYCEVKKIHRSEIRKINSK